MTTTTMSKASSKAVNASTPEASHDSVIRLRPGKADRDRKGFRRRRRAIDTSLRVGVPILAFILWQLAVDAGVLDRRFWPSPTDIWRAFTSSVESGILWDSLSLSGTRMVYGYVAGCFIGIVSGLILGVVRPLRVALNGLISALYTVPKLAILPVLLLLFGLGDAPKIILIALGSFFITVISTSSAVVAIPESLLEPIRSCQATQLQTLRHVTLPCILPNIFTALRIAAGNAVLVLVGIEFVQGGEGLGWLIWNSWQIYRPDRMYVGIIVVALLGALAQALVQLVGRKLTPWTAQTR